MSYTSDRGDISIEDGVSPRGGGNGRGGEAVLLAAALGIGALIVGGALLRERRKISVDGRVVLITGGSRGLGLVLARRLCGMGARVAICARDSEELSLALDDLRRCTGCEALAIPCDVTDREEAEAMVKSVEERLGPIDILINNAGMIAVGPMESMTEGDYAEALALHFWAPFNTIHAVLPSMKARRFGRIVNVASIGGKVAIPHLLPYSTSKHALVGFSQGLRAELVKDGIHVTTVCPGTVRTGSPRNALFKGQNEKEYAWFKLSDSLPGISQSAESCAAEIIGAVLHGDADLVTSLPAKLMAMVNGVLPGFVADAMGVVNGTLPEPGGVGTGERFGYESETELSNSRLTVLTRRAEEDNNQLAAGPNTAAPVPSPL